MDRDGVINQYPGNRDYVKSWKEFNFLPGVDSSLKRLNENNFRIFIISNQAGVAKEIYSKESLDLITENMLEALKKQGILIRGVFYCMHKQEDNCLCRKPKTGLLDKAIEGLKERGEDIDIGRSYFIGDTIIDVETGKAKGLNTILVFSGKEKPENKDSWKAIPDFTVRDLREAVDLILKR